ncbi:cell wall hydrolase [Phenylobacterium terrae]|uniref:Cell wall hydrolase n=1 Tax=Phenylobacterium terrae TaxID=2665495 RepID=A0ABW4N2X8_9CAUL
MIKARVDGRAFLSAALVGSGVGACLGAAFLAGGMIRDVETTPAVSGAEQLSLRGPLPAQGASLTHSAGGTEKVSVSLPPPAPQPAPVAAEARKVTPAKPFHAAGASDLECLTQAVYFEARGEGTRGQAAVAQVVLNRVRHPAFPRSVCDVVFQGANRRKGCQFSFACNGAMKARRESAAWREARQVASRALSGFVMAEVGSATHFHTTHVRPNWGPQLSRVTQVGLHVFYRLGRGGSRAKPQPEETETVYARLDRTQDAAADAASTDIKLTSAPATGDAVKTLELVPAKPSDATSKPAEAAPQVTPADAAAKPASDTATATAS